MSKESAGKGGEEQGRAQGREPTTFAEMPGRAWLPPLHEFAGRHWAWWERANSRGPVYKLPSEVIDALASSTEQVGSEHRGRAALISAEDAAAERAFAELCQRAAPNVLGSWNG